MIFISNSLIFRRQIECMHRKEIQKYRKDRKKLERIIPAILMRNSGMWVQKIIDDHYDSVRQNDKGEDRVDTVDSSPLEKTD